MSVVIIIDTCGSVGSENGMNWTMCASCRASVKRLITCVHSARSASSVSLSWPALGARLYESREHVRAAIPASTSFANRAAFAADSLGNSVTRHVECKKNVETE